jgi:hypothetical protein
MESQALKDLVKKLFSDQQSKQQFLSDPDSILPQFALTSAEKKAVLSSRAQLALATPDGQMNTEVAPLTAWV